MLSETYVCMGELSGSHPAVTSPGLWYTFMSADMTARFGIDASEVGQGSQVDRILGIREAPNR